MSNNLVIKKSLKAVIAMKFFNYIYKIIRFIEFCRKLKDNDHKFEFKGNRLSKELINECNQYGKRYLSGYKDSQQNDITEDSSQFFIYEKILERENKENLKICNIGAFYCNSDVKFLEKRPKSTVYALDFEPFVECNKNLVNPNLILKPGYPLDTIEAFANESNDYVFDYAIFTRTAVLMNPNELFSYMESLSKIAKNVAFLEVAQVFLWDKLKLDINKIPLDNPCEMYEGMRIHNYPKILEKYNYKIVESAILPPDQFNIWCGSSHYWIYTMGSKE